MDDIKCDILKELYGVIMDKLDPNSYYHHCMRYYQVKYEKCLDKKWKQELFKIEGKADFQNIFKIKLAHLQLGIGVLCNITEVSRIPEDEIKDATKRLSKLNEKQLPNRWKWGYYIAKSKICWLKGNLNSALKYAEVAYSHAVQGTFRKEVKGTEDLLKAVRSILPDSYKMTATIQSADCSDIRETESSSKLPHQESQPLNNFQLILDAINQIDRKLSKLDMLDEISARMSVLETQIDNINKPDMLDYLSAKMSALESQLTNLTCLVL
ncbi:unnamed protein product [Mytilus edulis]|uniref:Uncharacterized protein n=1 Tax=Mytilus edulis TaxID=6550 RepID=A0A8S3V6J2_MYTED|nr:unnamed protein product [Mytilus edulis]